jgi:redox-sensitive bicupin YhaK (pirin superfamily)
MQAHTMKTVLDRSTTRGYADHGWLKSHHTFSFAGYQNPKRMNFGMLRVLNDDVVQPKMGFWDAPPSEYGDYFHTSERSPVSQRQYG